MHWAPAILRGNQRLDGLISLLPLYSDRPYTPINLHISSVQLRTCCLKQHWLLGHHTNAVSQPLQVEGADVTAVQGDLKGKEGGSEGGGVDQVE